MRAISAWLRGFVFLGVLATMAVGARAADLAQEVGELAAAVDARLGGDATGKEAKKLTKATKKLAKLTGEEVEAKDLRKVLTAVYASKTTDATVLAEAQDVLDCLHGLVITRRTEAQSALDELIEKYRVKLVKKLDAAQRKLDAAEALVASNPNKATKQLEAAYLKFVRAWNAGQKFLARMWSIPNRVSITATFTAEGFQDSFSAWANAEMFFGSVSAWGCKGGGRNTPCKEILSIGFFEPPVGYTGPVGMHELSFTASSDYASGMGVQDLYWESVGGATVTITQSTTRYIKGRFEGDLESFSGQPNQMHVMGAFMIDRKKASQSPD